jgi:oligopeptide/dipeptide ABC transporter ATP-binding protein
MTEPLVQLRDLAVHFPLRRKGLPFLGRRELVRAVDGVDLAVARDEIFGVAGESGCGKSTIARVLTGLVEPTAGEMLYEGERVGPREREALRTRIQMVFQDPYASLNPRRTVADIVGDPLYVHTKLGGPERLARVEAMLQQVGLAAHHGRRYPHEFSGGQRQRIAIARALILDPEFLVLDEPTSALDVSVQAVILNLVRALKAARSLTCVFITHDLNLMRFMTDRLAVMYLGRVVETGRTADVFGEPQHPYTKALIAATPKPDPKRVRSFQPVRGEPPSPVNPPSGCAFHTRCPVKIEGLCERVSPKLAPAGKNLVACHLAAGAAAAPASAA